MQRIYQLKSNLYLFLQVHIPTIGFGQRIGFQEIDDSKVSPWLPKLTIEYQYVYHFGDSEMESDLYYSLGLINITARLNMVHGVMMANHGFAITRT